MREERRRRNRIMKRVFHFDRAPMTKKGNQRSTCIIDAWYDEIIFKNEQSWNDPCYASQLQKSRRCEFSHTVKQNVGKNDRSVLKLSSLFSDFLNFSLLIPVDSISSLNPLPKKFRNCCLSLPISLSPRFFLFPLFNRQFCHQGAICTNTTS